MKSTKIKYLGRLRPCNYRDYKITAIEISPDNSDIIWIAGNKGFYKSINGGNSWSAIFYDYCWDIKLKTDDPNTVFLAKSNTTKKKFE